MKVTELKDVLFYFIQDYFAGAIVRWGKLPNGTKPPNPFICLEMGTMKRPQHFIMETENGSQTSYIPTTVPLKAELFTHGMECKDEDGDVYFVNTAMDDMADFVSYMTSLYADDFYERLDISVRPEGDIKDTTGVRDSNYEFRAMQEFVVSFLDESNGYAGISRANWKPTPSGGGTEKLANKQIMDVDPKRIDIENEED